ncbi:GNAT family N-acetyltransferase [Limosilactobacillus fermentum]|uniref:GNAT family N-acetyltransferase n=1 Tax=Limosilactobacillus fermentum TaxID=1613 RepID=UPI001E3A79FD|nr:GNAT family N-acetyltransferase [Limosilactobacillus fermentum]MCC6110748.1 GNAT family N-acetyltransferase [Limosilactobacillus fermentum]
MSLTTIAVTKRLADYPAIRALYQRAFPRAEQVPWFWLMFKAKRSRAHFTAYYAGEDLVGFTYLIVGHNVNYLMYLAVNDRIRSKGYGTQILTHLKATYPAQTLVLEIEHPDPKATNAKQRFARLQFYLKNHFHQTPHLAADGPMTYQLLATDPKVDPAVIYRHHFRWFAWPLGWLYPAPKQIK